jgi:hypothetical protein
MEGCDIIMHALDFNDYVHITNFMGYDLTMLVMWNPFFIGLYCLNKYVVHFKILFRHGYCMYIHTI